LIAGVIAEVEDQAPDEIGRESSGKHHDQDREALPQRRGAVADGDLLDRVAGGETVGETGAHDAREGGDEKAAFEIELADGCTLLVLGHLALFGDARATGESDADEADGNTGENHLSGGRAPDLSGEHAAKDGREQGSK